jgi:hypothetical protein
VTGAAWGRLRARRGVRRHPSDGRRTYGFSPELVAGTASAPCARRSPRCTSCCSPTSTAPRFGTMNRCLVVVDSTGRSVPAQADVSRDDRPAADLQLITVRSARHGHALAAFAAGHPSVQLRATWTVGRDRRCRLAMGDWGGVVMAREKDPAEVVATIRRSIEVSTRGTRRVRFYRLRDLFGSMLGRRSARRWWPGNWQTRASWPSHS